MARKVKYTEAEAKASKIFSRLKGRVAKIKSEEEAYNLEGVWSRDDFIAWYKGKEKVCCYCGITEAESQKFNKKITSKRSATRGKSLEIERLKPHGKYQENNCELACYWCNNAKSDVFSVDEFKPISEAIGAAIKLRVKALP